MKMYEAKAIDYYTKSGAVFYRLEKNLDMSAILLNRLNDETEKEAIQRWTRETHWVAVWGSTEPVKGYHNGCTLSFNIKSSTFYPVIYHKNEELRDVRNINAKDVRVTPIAE